MKPIEAGWVFRVFLLGIILIGMFQVNIKYVQATETVTLTPVADAYVYSDTPDSNYGSETELKVGYYKKYMSFLKFDLSSLGTDIIVISAELKLKGKGDSFEINVDECGSDWEEDEIDWYNKPTGQESGIIQTTTFDGGDTYHWVTMADSDNLVNYLNNHLGEVVSFMMWQKTSSINYARFRSRETSDKPKLVITYDYTIKTVTVLPSENGYTTPEAGEYNVTLGNDFTITAYPNDGYAFQYWLVNGEKYFDNPLTITVTENLTIQPVFVMICLFDVTDLIYLLITVIPALMMGFVRFKTGSNLGVLFYSITLVVTTYCYIISDILPFYSIIVVGLYVFSILMIREGE